MLDLMKRLEIGIEELILLFLIIIEVMDFFTIIPPLLEYVEKITAIIAICYLFYKASITKITFGQREKNHDLIIVFAYLLLSLKTIMGFVLTSVHEKSVVQGIYTVLAQNVDVIEKTGFWLGGIMLIAAAYFLLHEKVKKPCILSIIHEAKKAEGVWKEAVRFAATYIILLAIFTVVFTPALEWLGLTVDAPILMIILFFYLFVIVKRGKGMKTETFLKRVSDSSESFYERFISLFHSRKTIAVAITGLLALHLLVDIGHFIIPYTTGLLYPWYFEQLGPGHLPLNSLMAKDFALAETAVAQIGVMAAYVLNVLAVLMLLFGPAYAWAHLYQKKRLRLPNILWLFFGSIAVFITLPVMRIGQVKSAMLLGVDITTQQIPPINHIWMALLIGALVACIFYILGRKNLRRTTKLGLFAVFIYFGIYLYHFFISLAKYYVNAITLLGKAGQYFIAAHLLIFFTITILFYTGGYIMFIHLAYARQNV